MGDISGDVSWNGHGVTIKSAPSDLVGLLAPRPACWKAMSADV